MVTVDLVVFRLLEGSPHVLLIRRKHEPFAGKWAIPGGYLEMDEPVDAAARRELREEAGLEIPGAIEPIGFFGKPGRDPRGRTITLAHAAVLGTGAQSINGSDDAAEARWIAMGDCSDLAFDHVEILAEARQWLARGLVEQTLGLELLPSSFERQQVHTLFDEVGLSSAAADRWVQAMIQSGTLKSDAGPSGLLHRIIPTT